MSMFDTIAGELDKFYHERLRLQEDALRVGWKNDYAQKIRFLQLLRAFNIRENFTINDLGCGRGDLFGFLSGIAQNDHSSYHGYDIREDMITDATKKYHDALNAKFHVIEHSRQMQTSDYTVASGIFNLRFTITDDDWLNYIHETLLTMYEKSRKGISFNCLTSYSDEEYMKPELYYTDPKDLFDFCKRNLSRNVSLFHDYNEYDFTIAVIK